MFAEDKLIEQDQPEQQVFKRRKKQGESSRFTLSHVVTLKRWENDTANTRYGHVSDTAWVGRRLFGHYSVPINTEQADYTNLDAFPPHAALRTML